MKNDHLLLSSNGKSSIKKFKINKNVMMIEYKFTKSSFNGVAIKEIIRFVNAVEDKYSRVKIPIHFNLGYIEIMDKLTYIMLECICNYLIETCNRNVVVSFRTNDTINTEGITSSPLLLLGGKQKSNIDKYLKKFKKELYKSHYRRIIETEEYEDDPFLMCRIMSEIDSFLKAFYINKKCRDVITEVIIELAGNALEHPQTDCLIDLDITEPYDKKDTDGKFYGVNITIVNFSPKLLGDSISEKLAQKELLNDRHLKLLDAYNIHKEHFRPPNYLEEDFYNIASFQHKISGRLKNESTGGTGLTKLICRLEDYSDSYHCYVITGSRGLFFRHDYLSYNEDGWIGFNKEKDFITKLPREEIIGNSYINMPGTAYNFNFVMKKEECYNEK